MSKKDDSKNLRFRLPDDLKNRWDLLCESRNISQQDAIRSLVAFAVSLDAANIQDVTLAMLFGQITAADDLVELSLKRMRDTALQREWQNARDAGKPSRKAASPAKKL